MFSVKGSTFTGYDGDGVIAEAGRATSIVPEVSTVP